MSDDEISDFFQESILTIPFADDRERAQQWLAEREAAFRVFKELQEKGLSALL